MDNPITASFRWSADELLMAHGVHLRHSGIGRKLRRGRWTIAPLAVVIGLVTLWRRGFYSVGLFFVVSGTVLLMFPLFARRITLKQYARRPDRDMLVSWEFYPDHIATKTEASSATLEWRMISGVLQTRQGFLLCPNDQVFHWLPVHAFRAAADREAFIQLAKSRVHNFEKEA